MRDKRDLVILTPHFGTNFSGGSLATCRIFELLQNKYNRLYVITEKVGKHNFKQIEHVHVRNSLEALRAINRFKSNDPIFYGDFRDSINYVRAGVPFYFTYHDNWPELRGMDFSHFVRSFNIIKDYKRIFKNAVWVFSVSDNKAGFIRKSTENCSVVPNGIYTPVVQGTTVPPMEDGLLHILMLGNIDKRKYKLALSVFNQLDQSLYENTRIDIYGHVIDKHILKELDLFPFVHYGGYAEKIDFNIYDMLINTSYIENLSISVVEALRNNTPVICFDVGGLSEVVRHEENGIVIPPYDTQVFAEAILKVSSDNMDFDFSQTDLSKYNWERAAHKYALQMGIQEA